MFEKMNQIVKLFDENSEAEAALKSAQTKEDAVALLNRYGVEISVEEFVEMGKEVASNELSEEMLMLVAGGGWARKAWGAFKDFFQGFLDAF